MPYVPKGLTRLHTDLGQRITLKEMQTQCLLLFSREGSDYFLQAVAAKDRFRGIIIFDNRLLRYVMALFDLHPIVELPRREVPPSPDCLVIGCMNNPRACRTLRTVEDCAFPLDEEE